MENVSFTNMLTGNGIQTTISGSLEIRDSAEIKNEFLLLLANHDHVELHFKNIDKIDLTALQLLMALSRSASDHGKKVHYIFEPTAYISEVLNNSGFNKFISV
ncbi:STAS domain-containing protein [Mucilaginibacter ginsenosidivorax]|uniref:STAS domain-containing protein n=1 Tax=Mucilaginibacter ginsenosidivorax TaxID=862126 RepID=A0A5B8VYF9_9SPHI|nr:STAS domain-containing protein [Mucilaginibacter ginsenosidivorax]QEC76444.1 STAS domain-containing protein [Mucilaginibacter ginsenosidivorax]